MQDAMLGFALVAITFFFVVGIGMRLIASPPRRRRYRTPYPPFRYDQPQLPDLTDPAQQLIAVMVASFKKQKVLTKEEYRVFRIVEADVAAACKGYRVLAQTNLGEILLSSTENARRSINSKRVDILVIDRGGWPILAIEYQGRSHYQGNAQARDKVKKEALGRAGVGYLEIFPSDSDSQIRSRVREQLGWETATPADGRGSAHVNAVPAQHG